MLDCGIHPGFSGMSSLPFLDSDDVDLETVRDLYEALQAELMPTRCGLRCCANLDDGRVCIDEC